MRKKVILLSIIVSLMLLFIPTCNEPINAQEPIVSLPTNEQFATKEQLMNNFDTKISDGDNSAKVYFGNNDQQWWIAGSQDDDSIVLFAATPLIDEHIFKPYSGDLNKNNDEWKDCNYLDQNIPNEVFNTHYGASSVRKKLKAMATDTNYFSENEQSLLQITTVYTKDNRNDTIYSTNDKLYCAYGSNVAHSHVYVGSNTQSELLEGLIVDNKYWNTDDKGFWLRADTKIDNNMFVFGGIFKTSSDTLTQRQELGYITYSQPSSIQPATSLDISNVLFGSSALPVAQQNDNTIGDAFTLRHKSDSVELGSALILIDKKNVELKDVPKGTYLVAQNSKGVYSKEINDEKNINASDMQLETFENCQVWLESTVSEQRMTYAKMAEQEQPYNVDVHIKSDDKSLNVVSLNNHQVVGQGREIESIVIETTRGYSINDTYIESLNTSISDFGIKATRDVNKNNSFIISGIPNQNIDITLDSAIRNKAKNPQVATFDATASTITITITDIEHKDSYGDPVYSLDGKEWQKENFFENLAAGQQYTVQIKYSESDDFAESDITELNIQTSPAQYTITIPSQANADGNEHQIKISEGTKFDIGHNGSICVKINDTGNIQDGYLTLERQNDSEKKSVLSEIKVNGNTFKDLTKDIAIFKDKSDVGARISFENPSKNFLDKIYAGTYTGTIIYEIEYIQ